MLAIDGINRESSDGVGPQDIPKIIGDILGKRPGSELDKSSGGFNCYPGVSGYGCCELSVFVSLKSPSNTKGRRGHYSFSEILQYLVRHMQGICPEATRYVVLITDRPDHDALDFWRPNLKRIIGNGALIEIYLIEGGHIVLLPV